MIETQKRTPQEGQIKKGGRATYRPRANGTTRSHHADYISSQSGTKSQVPHCLVNQEVEKSCRDLARSIIREEYAVTDEIWKRRVSYQSVAADYDGETIREIHRRMPNLLVKKGGVPLDELADEYGFESCCALVEKFLTYTNKSVVLDLYYNKLLDEHFDGASDVPF